MSFWDGTRWVPDNPQVRTPRRGRAADWVATILMFALIPILLVVLAAGVAAKPSSSVWITELAGTSAAASVLQFGDGFTVGYSTHDREPWASAKCYPNASTVFSGTYADGSVWASVFSVYPGGPSPQSFVLGHSVQPLWTGGGADCSVDLVTFSHNLSRVSVLATTRFTVSP